ncbi:MAG: flagellar hook-associated protein FlgK [Alphaproteobacteria bacterium]|nr:flagellar hook-associated protein FlgK [Alphaproteobacteria bacterium]
MSSLGLSMNNALTGLRATQRNIAVLSHNIANVSTPGYSRQIVNQEAQVVGGVGSGVRINDVVRNIDRYLQRSITTQQSSLSRTDVIDEFHDRLQILFGEPGASNSLDEYVSTFFNSLQQLAETPERTSFRTGAVDSAITLASQISELAFQIENLRYEADREIGQAVTAVNDLMSRLDVLNTAISRSYTLGQSTPDLLDQRDIILNDMASYMDITTFFEESGRVSVLTSSGISLVDGTPKRLQYSVQGSAQSFIDDASFNSLSVATLDSNGNLLPNPQTLISAGQSSAVTTQLTGGTLKGLQELRDTVLPDVLDMLDMLSSRLRDEVNAIHNNGSAFPGRASLTGTRLVSSADQYNWTGSVRIGVLSANGEPAPAGYLDEAYTGARPLNLDLTFLDSGQGTSRPNMQTIIDEINNHFRAPPVKAKVGNANNIQLVSTTDFIPNVASPNFRFDLDIDNISKTDANIFVTGFTVLDDTATNITSVTTGAPQITLNPVGTYTTTVGTNNVQVAFNSTPTVNVGDTIYLSPPAGAVNGLTPAQLTGYFQVISVVGNQVEIQVTGAPAGPGGPVSDATVYAQSAYDTIDAGEKRRTRDSGGQFALDLSGNFGSAYYDITLDVAVVDEQGALVTSTITYRVNNNQTNMLNDRFDNTAVGGNGQRVIPNNSQEFMSAILVDADGMELPKINGRYIGADTGYLKFVARDGLSISIDEMNSKQLGDFNVVPTTMATNRGFSHFFGLNNLFKDNLDYREATNLKNSAIDLEVEDAIVSDPNLIATGKMVLQRQPSNPNDIPQYTYVRYSGDNQTAMAMAAFSTKAVGFDAAGGTASSTLTVGGYVSELLGYVASEAVSATSAFENQQVLFNGLSERQQSVSGVNLDEELANTITFQNAYAANARVISLVNQLFEDLIGAFG